MISSRLLAAVAVLATLLVAVETPAPAAAARAAALSAGQGGPFVGVWTGGPSAAEAASLDDLGAAWARVTVNWSTLEPSSGTFALAPLDPQMAAASGGGRRTVVAQVRNNPTWAAATRCTLTTDPERQQLATFMGALATRYKSVVWQLYNEEDNTSPASEAQSGLGGCFGTVEGGVQTATGRVRYAKAIEVAAAAIHAADPTAQVATGGVSSGSFTDQGGPFDRQFLPCVLAQLKQDNSLASVDYVTVHYYSSQSFLYVATGVDLIGRVEQLRQDTLAAGLTAAELKPVISDELSYTGTTGTSTSDPTNAFNLAQRAYVPKLLARAAAADVRAAFWFWMQDASAGLGSDVPYGIKDMTGTPKPAYRAIKYFTSLIRRRDQFVRSLSLGGAFPKLEGYEFNTVDGRLVQIVWNQQDTTQIAYAVQGSITSVADAEGNAVTLSGGSVAIGSEPRFIFYTYAPATSTPTPIPKGTPAPTATPTATPVSRASLTSTATPTAASVGGGVVPPAPVPPAPVAAPAAGGTPNGAGGPPVQVAGVTVPVISANPAEITPAGAPSAAPVFAIVSIGLLAPEALVAGQPATLTLVMLNPGTIDASSTLTVLDTLPPELTLSAVVADGWSCASDDGQLVTCSSASPLTAGSLARIQLLVNTSTDASGLVTNTATLNSPSLDPAAPLPTTVDTLQILDMPASASNDAQP